MRLRLARPSLGAGASERRRRLDRDEYPLDERGTVLLTPRRASSCARASGEKILMV